MVGTSKRIGLNSDKKSALVENVQISKFVLGDQDP